MHIAIACGGTGGHVFPGLATAETLKRRGHDVVLWLAGRNVENISIEGWQGRVVRAHARGFQTTGVAGNIAALFGLVGSIFRCRRLMRENRPDVLLAMGSYASFGPVIAAAGMGIPVVLHEANAVPGRAVSFLARFASCVAVGFKTASNYFRHPNVVFTGFPLRQNLGSGFKNNPLSPDTFTVLVMGGSQGAHCLNEVAPEAFSILKRKGADFQVIHLSGPNDESAVRARYEKEGIKHMVFGFLREMGNAYAEADLAVSRSGAAACAELAAFAVPAVLVPLPCARRDHQKANAMELKKAGCVEVIAQQAFSSRWLAGFIEKCMKDPADLDKMRRAMSNYAINDAAERLADIVCGCAKDKKGS